MLFNLCFVFFILCMCDKGFVAGATGNDDHHRMMERLEVLEKQHQDSQSKIESLERTVRSQAEQITAQARAIKGFDFIVHKHRARVQEAYRTSRLNSRKIIVLQNVLVNTGLIKKENVGDKESQHETDEEHKLIHKKVLSVESNLPEAMNTESKLYHREPTDSGTKHQRQTRIMRRNVTANERLASGKRQGSEGIAFSVYLDHDVDLGAHQTVKFSQIITNERNGYSPHSGVFTCPEGGMYMFSFFIGERDSRGMFAELMVNSKNVLDAIVDSTSPNQDLTGGNVAVIRLNQGDAVWVESHNTGDHAEGSAAVKLTSFSGVYLFP
ncbi:uncharacterized protein LOC123528126 [Mercenaria mercenaria]|uniref:uncharacterized protein LOC123528126 n=1 Tax=Mercenaria mercenaria TaxID=6596 RepID=UPI00234FA4AC|nr:uncharacterized protein LOC123528126 [Mercenaria mercenaria]